MGKSFTISRIFYPPGGVPVRSSQSDSNSQDCPSAIDEVKSVRERFQLLWKLVGEKSKDIAGFYLTTNDPFVQIMSKYIGQTVSLWHQWLTHVIVHVDLQSVQQTLQRFHSRSIVSPQTIIADLAYLTEQAQLCASDSEASTSLFCPRAVYGSTCAIAQRIATTLDTFKIDVVPRLIAISDFDYIHSPLEPLVGEGMELLSSMIATSDCDEIAEKLEAEYEAVIASSTSLGSPQHEILLQLESLFGELRFIEKLQLIHGLFSVLQTVPSGASRLAAISSVVERIVVPMLGQLTEPSSSEIPAHQTAKDSNIILILSALLSSTLEDPVPGEPTLESMSEKLCEPAFSSTRHHSTISLLFSHHSLHDYTEFIPPLAADPDDVEAKQKMCEAISVTREAILEETMAACTILADPSCSRIALESEIADMSRQDMVDATSAAIQELQLQVQTYWQPIGWVESNESIREHSKSAGVHDSRVDLVTSAFEFNYS